jgi:hypothetical protein
MARKWRRKRLASYVEYIENLRNAYTILVRASEGKIPLWRSGYKW